MDFKMVEVWNGPFFLADAHVLFGFGESEGSRTAGDLRFVGEMHSLYPDLTCVGNSCMAIGQGRAL